MWIGKIRMKVENCQLRQVREEGYAITLRIPRYNRKSRATTQLLPTRVSATVQYAVGLIYVPSRQIGPHAHCGMCFQYPSKAMTNLILPLPNCKAGEHRDQCQAELITSETARMRRYQRALGCIYRLVINPAQHKLRRKLTSQRSITQC